MTSADAAWVDVLPSLSRFLPDLRRALADTMPRAGQDAGRDFGQGFTRSAVSSVEQASAKLAAARKKEADAAGAVRVAEAKLRDLRDSGKAKAAQLVAAEENLAKAKRTLDAQTDAVAHSTRQLTAAQEQAARASQRQGDSTRRADGDMGRATRSAGALGGAMTSLKKLVFAAGAAFAAFSVLDFAKQSVASIQRIERINAQTEAAIRSTGGAAEVTGQHIFDLTGNLENLTATEAESIQQGANFLLTFTNIKNGVGANNDIFDQAVGLMTDMTRAMDRTGGANLDTSKTALQLGKALNDPIKGITALSRVGVSFNEQQKETIRTLVESGDVMGAQKIILAELAKEFGGAGEAFAKTTAGKVELAKHALGTLGETIVGFVLPTLGDLAEDGATAMNSIATGFQTGEVTSQGFAGAMERLGAVLAGVFDFLGVVASGVGDLVGWVVDLPGPVQASAAALGAWLLLRGPLTSLFTTIQVGIQTVASRAVAATTSLAAFRIAAGGLLGLLGGPIGLAIAGVTLAIGFLSSKTEKNADVTEDAAKAQTQLTQALEQSKGAITDNVRAAAAKEAQDRGLIEAAKIAGVPLSLVTDAILGQGDAYARVSTALQGYLNEHTYIGDAANAEDAARLSAEAHTGAVRDGLDALTALNGTTAQSITSAQDLAAATSETATATGTAAVVAQDWQTELEDTATAASDAKQATDLLKTSLDILTGAHVSMAEAESAFFAAVAQADGALKDMSGSVLTASGNLNVQSEAGRAAQDVLFGIKDSANQVIATMIQQGATSEQVMAKDAQLRESFIKSAMQMGISRDAAEKLADQIYGIPAERKTTITADTRQASEAAAELQRQINAIKGRVVTITARAVLPDLNGSASGSGRMGTFAEGGYTGPGPKNRPAGVVHAGEVVFSQQDVAAHGGVAAVESLRRSRPRGYADGGPVGPIGLSLQFDPSRYNAEMDSAASRLAKALEPAGRAVAALAWAKTQVGKPYIWGGAGPAGYDCSGFMSAVTNVIRGRSPHSRLGSTATFPWAGFAPGYGMFSIGSTVNAGGGIGHMAGTLLGVNVESRGGQGVVVGPSARGASNSLFGTRAHLLFDDGGLWPSGQFGFNDTGGVERVLTPRTDDYFRRLIEVTERAESGSRPTEVNGFVNHGTMVFRDEEEFYRRQEAGRRETLASLGLT